ncbi:MAG TPA: YcnI family protein [Solirubrobacteraceae bacterium]|nr:YcnI family protein [Solirubrobacteraceae bacterium]
MQLPDIRPRAAAAVAATVALAFPAAAAAHVTIQPTAAPAGGFTRVDVRVPNERDDAGTTQVRVQLPPGFASVSYEPRPGWKVTLKKVKLDEPIKTEDGFEIDEGIGEITWTGDGKQGVIAPGQFVDFGLSLKMPDGKAGDKLTFKALQTYDDGDVVRWIGPEDADEPAPTVTLTAAPAPAQNASAPVSDDEGSDGLAIAALIVGAIALLAALAALFGNRRTLRTPARA